MSTTPSLSGLKAGTSVRLRFHGSKLLGNGTYELDGTLSEITEDADGTKRRKLFQAPSDAVEIYFVENRWRYGTSAEVVSVAEVL